MAKMTYEAASVKFVPLDAKGNPKERWHLPDGHMLQYVHSKKSCEGEFCVIHKPSDHPLRAWPLMLKPQIVGKSNPMFVRQCSCEELHLDPDEVTFFKLDYENCNCLCGCCAKVHAYGG